MPSTHAKSRRAYIFESLCDALEDTIVFRNRVLRTLSDTSKTPYCHPFIGPDTIEDFARDESNKAIYGGLRGITQCGVTFAFTTNADTKDTGKMIVTESDMIDAIEQAVINMIGERRTIPQNNDTGGYTIIIDYVQPTSNQVIQLDMGGKTVETSAVILEVGWTQKPI